MKDVISFGEILWDVIDGVPHLGGAPFNFAAHCAKCGLKTAIVSAVGGDVLGRRALDAARGFGVDVSFAAVLPDLPTGTVEVTVTEGIPAYDIRTGVAWDKIPALPALTSEPCPRAVYFGTLVQRTETSAATLHGLLARWQEAEVFFDVNLRQTYWSRDLVLRDAARATLLKLNDEELATLALDPVRLFAECPRLKVVIVTKGADGCEVYGRAGEYVVSPAVPAGPVVDTVGAGDAFSAAFLAAWLSGAPLIEAAQRGNVRGGYVASRAGAIPD